MADYDNQTGSFNDKSITNNGDLVTVLATVIQIIQDFTTQNPDAFVYIEGNTPIKQRLYNRIVNRSLSNIETLHSVSGILPNGDKEAFALNVDYIAIILEPKY
ncbi:MAG: hypothetical protein EAZ95_04700 [Bacteroidetes bacterium]|nr:MAG: hypothetical protein EAZ95_04700 [Bacteroidota bacterium]